MCWEAKYVQRETVFIQCNKFLFGWRFDCLNFITSFQFCCFGFLSSHSLQWRVWKWKSLEELTGCPVEL